MKITPTAGPQVTAQTTTPGQSSRDRAVAKLQGSMTPTQAASSPQVHNQNSVSPEEAAALSAPKHVENHTSEGSDTPAATPEKSEPLSSQYAQLARREKALRAKHLEVKQQEAAFKAKEEALKLQESQYRQNLEKDYIPRSRLSEDPLSALGDVGLSYDELTQRVLNQPPPEQTALLNELKAMRDEIKALKSEQESTKKSYEDNQSNAYKQAVETIRRDVQTLVRVNPEFETIKETRSVGDVVDLIERTFKEGLGEEYPAGTVLDIEIAAQMVEDHLVEEALKIARINKISKKLQPAQVKQETPKQQPQANTLSNSLGSSRPLTNKERALLAFEGKLKS